MDPEAVAILHRVAFLAGLDAAQLDPIAARLAREDFAAGQTISVSGARPAGGPRAGIRIVAAGRVELAAAAGRGEWIRPVLLSPGDHWGELDLFGLRSPPTTARAVEACTVYRWDRADVVAYLLAHPDLQRRLRFLADTRRLALGARLDWLAQDESLRALARRHLFFLARSLAAPAVLAAAAAALLAAGLGTGSPPAWLGGLLALVAAAWAAWNWLDWTNDYYLITDRRAAWLEKIVGLYDSRRETPLSMVLSVDLSTEVLGRWLGFGDVSIRTYTGQLVFRGVGQPATMAALIEESWRRVQEQDEREGRAEIGSVLRQALQPAPAERTPDAPPAPPAPAPPRAVGLDHWTFQVRFEEKGVITYRKHWAVLLGALGLPSFLILLFVGLLGAQIGGLTSGPPPETTLLLAAALLVPLSGWWLYRYLDWANDIYQVTPDQIRDIYKKPLGREIRKVAPLENILGTEVDRRGLSGLVLNYGDVITNIGASTFVFHGVYDPQGVQQDIARALEALLARKREVQKRQRQGEMVEWLTSYHEQAGPPSASRAREEAAPPPTDPAPG